MLQNNELRIGNILVGSVDNEEYDRKVFTVRS